MRMRLVLTVIGFCLCALIARADDEFSIDPFGIQHPDGRFRPNGLRKIETGETLELVVPVEACITGYDNT